MTDRTDVESPDALVLMHALENLRTRDALTRGRLQDGKTDVGAPLLALAATRRFATVRNVGLAGNRRDRRMRAG
jgi:ribokinase